MGDKVWSLAQRIVNAKYSVPTIIWVLVSTVVGMIVILFAFIDPTRITPFLMALPFLGKLWGPLLTLGGVSTLIGMAGDWSKLVRFGSFLSFCMWVFGAFAMYMTAGLVNILIFAGPILTFWAYIYIASYIRDIPRL